MVSLFTVWLVSSQSAQTAGGGEGLPIPSCTRSPMVQLETYSAGLVTFIHTSPSSCSLSMEAGHPDCPNQPVQPTLPSSCSPECPIIRTTQDPTGPHTTTQLGLVSADSDLMGSWKSPGICISKNNTHRFSDGWDLTPAQNHLWDHPVVS